MPESRMTELESLKIIQNMIQTAKDEQKDNGVGWISWGWLLFLASALSVVNEHTHWYSQYFFWNIFGICTIILSLVAVFRSNVFQKRPVVKTYTSALFQKLNIGFAITLMILIVALNKGLSPLFGFALLSSLYGFWILIYGAALQFRPSLIGAYFTWVCSLAGLFVHTFEHSMILHGLGVLAGYIIPGHLAWKEFQKTKRAKDLHV